MFTTNKATYASEWLVLKSKKLETLQGKLLLCLAWVFALANGHIVSIIFSVIASILAAIYWIIKIVKELKK